MPSAPGRVRPEGPLYKHQSRRPDPPVRAQRARPEPRALLACRWEAQCPSVALTPRWFPQPLPCSACRLLVRRKRQPRAASTWLLAPSARQREPCEHRSPIPARSTARSGGANLVVASDSTSKALFIPLRLRRNELNETAPAPFLRAPCTPRLLRKGGGPRGAPTAPGERTALPRSEAYSEL